MGSGGQEEETGGPKTPPLDCRRLAELMCDYVDESLPNDLRQRIDGHLSQCAPCLAFLRQYKFAPDALRRSLLEKVPPDLENRLVSFLRQRLAK